MHFRPCRWCEGPVPLNRSICPRCGTETPSPEEKTRLRKFVEEIAMNLLRNCAPFSTSRDRGMLNTDQ